MKSKHYLTTRPWSYVIFLNAHHIIIEECGVINIIYYSDSLMAYRITFHEYYPLVVIASLAIIAPLNIVANSFQ